MHDFVVVFRPPEACFSVRSSISNRSRDPLRMRNSSKSRLEWILEWQILKWRILEWQSREGRSLWKIKIGNGFSSHTPTRLKPNRRANESGIDVGASRNGTFVRSSPPGERPELCFPNSENPSEADNEKILILLPPNRKESGNRIQSIIEEKDIPLSLRKRTSLSHCGKGHPSPIAER